MIHLKLKDSIQMAIEPLEKMKASISSALLKRQDPKILPEGQVCPPNLKKVYNTQFSKMNCEIKWMIIMRNSENYKNTWKKTKNYRNLKKISWKSWTINYMWNIENSETCKVWLSLQKSIPARKNKEIPHFLEICLPISRFY